MVNYIDKTIERSAKRLKLRRLSEDKIQKKHKL